MTEERTQQICVKCGKQMTAEEEKVWSAPLGEPAGWWCMPCHTDFWKNYDADIIDLEAGLPEGLVNIQKDVLDLDANLAEFLESIQKRVEGLEHEATNARLYTGQVDAQVKELQKWVAGLNTRLGKLEMKLENLLLALEHSRLGLKLVSTGAFEKEASE